MLSYAQNMLSFPYTCDESLLKWDSWIMDDQKWKKNDIIHNVKVYSHIRQCQITCNTCVSDIWKKKNPLDHKFPFMPYLGPLKADIFSWHIGTKRGLSEYIQNLGLS